MDQTERIGDIPYTRLESRPYYNETFKPFD